ncbi:MAG: TolC family protein [Breznakibacter sp.]
MKPIFFTVFFLWGFGIVASGQELTLDECLAKAQATHPLSKNQRQIDEITALKLRSLQSQYYPQFDLTGQISWQNDVTHMTAASMPITVPTAPKDQYKAYVDVRQVIYDGGTTLSSKKLEQARNQADQRSLQVELYQVENGVIQSYFLVLAIDKQLEQLKYSLGDLDARLKESQVKIQSGWMLQSQADLFEVEILRLKQREISLTEARKASLATLEEYTGTPLAGDVVLGLPAKTETPGTPQRPELALYDAQKTQLEASKETLDASRMPKLSAFGQMGYGNPGYNMLADEFDTFYMVGLRLNWNIWDWHKARNDKQALSLQQQMVDQRQENLLRQIRVQRLDIGSRIANLEQSLAMDEKIVTLRQNITKTALSQLDNGVITAADYVARLNEEAIARLSADLHHVELAKAEAELAFVMGR